MSYLENRKTVFIRSIDNRFENDLQMSEDSTIASLIALQQTLYMIKNND
jgi:hypothetical protein